MVAKKIMCSFSEGDEQFCKDKRLSPSKLLQERITQIRDEENPALREMIINSNRKLDNVTKKLHYFTGAFGKLSDAAQKLIPAKEWDKIIEKIIT